MKTEIERNAYPLPPYIGNARAMAFVDGENLAEVCLEHMRLMGDERLPGLCCGDVVIAAGDVGHGFHPMWSTPPVRWC